MTGKPVVAALLTASLCVLVVSACKKRGPTAELQAARAEYGALRTRLEAAVGKDPSVVEALAEPADVLVGIRTGLVQSIVGQVADRYLDRVALDLALDAKVHEKGDVKVKTFVGRIHAGTWTMDMTIHRVTGTLRARRPHVAPARGNALRLQMPVVLEKAQGSATVHFAWDARSVGALVCRDFEVIRQIGGEVLPDVYPVVGEFRLAAGPEAIRAEPIFPSRSFRIKVDLTTASWEDVRRALDEQDRLLRCGMAIDPDEMMEKLRALLHGGFDVKLPASLFRPVDLPAAVSRAVQVEDRRVELAVETRALRVTPRAVWYAADIRTRTGGASPSAAPRAPVPRRRKAPTR